MNWKLELAKIKFYVQGKESLPEIAAKALEEGSDTPSLRILAGLTSSLRILAGLTSDNFWDIETYLEKTLQELHIEPPSVLESAWLMIEYYIDRIIKREIEPYEGVEQIISIYVSMDWDKNDTKYAGDSVGMEELYGLWGEDLWEEEPSKRYRQAYIEAAKHYKDNYLTQRVGAPDRP